MTSEAARRLAIDNKGREGRLIKIRCQSPGPLCVEVKYLYSLTDSHEIAFYESAYSDV